MHKRNHEFLLGLNRKNLGHDPRSYLTKEGFSDYFCPPRFKLGSTDLFIYYMHIYSRYPTEIARDAQKK